MIMGDCLFMIENKLGGYSIGKLSLILLAVVYLDMLTTFIGYNLGMYELNIILNAILEFNPIMIIFFPFIVLGCMITIFFLFNGKWNFELRIAYILYIFTSLMASCQNLLFMFS